MESNKSNLAEIFTATLFATVAFIGGITQVMKLVKNNRFKGFMIYVFKEKDDIYPILFDILRYAVDDDTPYNETIKQRKYTTNINKKKEMIARDLVCFRPKEEWFYSLKRIRLLYFRKASKHRDKNGKRIMKKKIMLMCRYKGYVDYFIEWFQTKEFKPGMLNIVSSESINKEVEI